MKTLSNEELQLAINKSVTLYHSAHEDAQPTMLSHLQELLLEQRVKATQSVTLEPMEPAPGRVDFDARVRGQDGPKWVQLTQLDSPVPTNHNVEVLYVDGNTERSIAGYFDWSVMGCSNAIDKYRDWTAWEQSK